MRTTTWLLPVGLLLAVIGGCSSSRFGLAKSDAPAKKPKDADVVEYGNPWKKPKKDEPVEPKELPPELAKLKRERQEAKDQKADVTPWLKNAAVAESKGELGAAKELYKKILDKDPNNAEAHHRLAVIADQQQDPQTADVHYQTALKLNRKDADLLSDMGYSLYLRGKLSESEARLKEALEANPYHRGAHSNLGLVYGKQGQYDQALAAFRQAGTESDAQRNMAQLFPNGRPGSNNAPAGTNVADNASRAPAMPSDIDQQLAGSSMDDIRQRMQQEREAAVRARQSQQQRENRPEFRDLEQPLGANRGNPPPAVAMNNPNPATNANPAWPPVASTPPATFNGSPTSPMNAGIPHTPPSTATNVAKPAESNPFWSGNLGNSFATTPTPPAAPMNPNSAFAQNVAPPANPFGSAASAPGMPPQNSLSGADPSAAWTNNEFGNPGSTNAFANPDRGVQPAGFNDFPASHGAMNPAPGTMSDASRMAAQLAMATGPGGLLPVVTPGRGPVSASQNSSNGVKWAYGEMSGSANRNVENAVWTQPPAADRVTPASNTNNSGFGSSAPAQPWADWQSPAPAGINWNDTPNNNAGPTPPAWNSNAPAGNGSANSSIPAWPGNPTNATPNSAGGAPENSRWNDFPSVGSGRAADPAMNSNPNGGSTTIPNWPYAPSRP